MIATDPPIQPPPRSGAFGVAIIVIDVFLLTIIPFSRTISVWMVITSLPLIAAALLSRNLQALHLSIFTEAFIVAPYLNPSLRSWPFSLLIPILCYGIIVLMVPALRTSALWVRRGAPDKTTVIAAAIISVAAGIALVLWYVKLKPDLSVQLHNVPAMPLWLFPVAGIAFAASNAAIEEFAYRGIIMQALDSAFGPGFISLLVQAGSFGAMHYLQGFPKGAAGVAMTIAYGFMLGWLRRRSQGMLAPWVTHMCADMVIFIILVSIALAETAVQ
ncbi:MAG TPA: CPBP family intramembrane glutamic endopeptidase [Nitrospirota bacterium]|nr:CPBP family intramembrane glutamic endopeptidase [Nitrospirota bacterium]